MKELNTAFNSFLKGKIDAADLRALTKERIKELKQCQRNCQYFKELKNIRWKK